LNFPYTTDSNQKINFSKMAIHPLRFDILEVDGEIRQTSYSCTKKKDLQARTLRPRFCFVMKNTLIRSHGISPRLSLKRRGEVAEAAFLHKVGSMGFSVAKPWGDSDPYDFIVQSGSKCWRVQVKSAYVKNEGGYSTSLFGGTRRRGYTHDDIDFLVAYAVPEDVWYVVPVDVFRRAKQIRFYPGSPTSEYEKYREAWCLMACPRDGKMKDEVEVEQRCEVCPRGKPLTGVPRSLPLLQGAGQRIRPDLAAAVL